MPEWLVPSSLIHYSKIWWDTADKGPYCTRHAVAGLNLNEAQLLKDPELLRAIIQYHVVPQRSLTIAQLRSGDVLPTLSPRQLLKVRLPCNASFSIANT